MILSSGSEENKINSFVKLIFFLIIMYPVQPLTIQLYLFQITWITALKMTPLLVYLLFLNVSVENKCP